MQLHLCLTMNILNPILYRNNNYYKFSLQGKKRGIWDIINWEENNCYTYIKLLQKKILDMEKGEDTDWYEFKCHVIRHFNGNW